MKLDYDWDRDGAQRELQRALQLNPGSSWVHHWYAHSLEAQNRLEDAMKEMRAALDLDPLSIPINWDIGTELLSAKRTADAVEHLKKANDLFPNNPVIGYLRAEALYRQGQPESAHRVIEALKASEPEMMKQPFFVAFLGIAAGREGRIEEARRVLGQLEQVAKTQYVEPFVMLELCFVVKDHNRLNVWIKRMEEERSTMFVYLPLLAQFFENDPGVESLITKNR